MKSANRIVYIVAAAALLALGSCHKGGRGASEQTPAASGQSVAEPSAKAPVEHRPKSVGKNRVAKRLRVHSFEGLSGSISEGMVMRLRVVNDLGYSITFAEGDADIYMDNMPLLAASLRDKVVLPRRSDSVVEVPLNLTISNPIMAISALSLIRKKDFSRFTVAFDGAVEALGRKELFKVGQTPVPQILEVLGYE